MAHLNNAGAALPTTGTVETMVEHLRREETMGGYEAAAAVADRLAALHSSAARLQTSKPSIPGSPMSSTSRS